MKKFILLFCLLCLCSSVFAQKKEKKEEIICKMVYETGSQSMTITKIPNSSHISVLFPEGIRRFKLYEDKP